MNFYISDTHWGQKDIIAYDKRPYSTIEQCFEDMKQKWNSKVKAWDDVYLIGDVTDRNVPDIGIYMSQLNGRKHLIVGNHDNHIQKNKEAIEWFVSVETIGETRDENGNIIVMCHYPIACWHHMDKQNCFHIYGHIHGKAYEIYANMHALKKAYNAGCMINNYEPVTLQELIHNNEIYWKEKVK